MAENIIAQSEEIWKPVVGWEGLYEVSSFGRVKSLPRLKVRPKSSHFVDSKILSMGPSSKYICATLYRRGEGICRTIHTLVLEAFVGKRPDGLCVRHLNGVKSDNRLSNLTYGTAKENAADRLLHGTQQRGEDVLNSVLTDEIVLQARKRYKFRCPINSVSAMAREFNVRQDTLHLAVIRKTWAHLDPI